MSNQPEPPSLQTQLVRIARSPDHLIDPTLGSLVIAAAEQPGFDPASVQRLLEGWGGELRERLGGVDSDLEQLDLLRRFLFEEKELTGDVEGYQDVDNCFLNRVLERKKGIPLTLSLIVLDLARRTGIPLEGVGFPGHFLVRHGRHPDIVMDPFHGGRLLTLQDCATLLEKISRGQIPFSRDLLRPCNPRQILLRLLNNLRGVYLAQRRIDRALEVTERILVLYPETPTFLRDRGILRLKTGRYPEGVRDVQAYLEAEPDAEDWNDLAEIVEQAKEGMAGHSTAIH